jgi:hypothetical protein
MPSTVVASRRPWIRVAGSVLYVLERHTRLAGSGDERDPERVRPDLPSTVELSSRCESVHHAPRLWLTHAPVSLGDEERPRCAVA